MDLTNEFRVAIPVDRAWVVLTDLERIAPCMPGAQLQEVEGDVYRGVVKVKVGPVQAQYKGEVEIIERDDDAHVAVLKADGRESRGQGNASATITARLTPDGDGTAVSILTELTITGRVAQFGRGVLADVSAGLLDQFVERLESTVLAEEVGGPTATGDAPSRGEPSSDDSQGDAADPAVEAGANQSEPKGEGGPTSAVRRIDSPEAEPVDLMAAAGSPVAKRAVPLAIAAAAIAVLLLILRSRRRGGANRRSSRGSGPR